MRVGDIITDSHDFHLLSVKSFRIQQVGDDGMFIPLLEERVLNSKLHWFELRVALLSHVSDW